jgi:hypothetical protein
MSRIPRFVASIALAFVAQSALAQPVPVSTPLPAASPASPTIGLYFSAEQGLNNAKLQGIRYVGECPGGQSATAQAKFISSKTPPGPGLRVIIRNNGDLIEGQAPFTDRKYAVGDGIGRSASPKFSGDAVGDKSPQL